MNENNTIDLCKLSKCDKQEKINNLQSKIDKAIKYINTHEYPSMYGLRENDLSKKELLDILKEDK